MAKINEEIIKEFREKKEWLGTCDKKLIAGLINDVFTDEWFLKVLSNQKKVDREKLAALCHEQWSGWMKYMFSKSKLSSAGCIIIPKDLVDRWCKQMNTPYKKLSEEEKNSDRAEADKFIKLIK